MSAALADVPHEARFVRRISDGSIVSERVLRVRVAPAVARSAAEHWRNLANAVAAAEPMTATCCRSVQSSQT